MDDRRRLFEDFKKRNKDIIDGTDNICDTTCPCCGFPTQTERHSFEICPLCDWEDDGQDDPDADNIWGGANKDYSLTEARENFDRYFTMYRPSDKQHFDNSVAKMNFKGDVITDKIGIKKKIISKFHELYKQTDKDVIKSMSSEIYSTLWSL